MITFVSKLPCWFLCQMFDIVIIFLSALYDLRRMTGHLLSGGTFWGQTSKRLWCAGSEVGHLVVFCTTDLADHYSLNSLLNGYKSSGVLKYSYSWAPEGRLGMSDVLPPSLWNLRAVIWFHFATSSLVLLPSPVTLSVLSFSACWSFLLNFFQKILQYFSLRDRLFCMAPV